MLKRWSRSWGLLECDEEPGACQCPEPLAEACKQVPSIEVTITEIPNTSHMIASQRATRIPEV